ncbi:MAG TPA: O-antigen ligase family protein [Ruminococcus sp.]|nr:O-antigen ligase family protein [Ruminococcus sp.]
MAKISKKSADPPEIPGYRVWIVCAAICAAFAGIFLSRLHIEELTGRSLEIFASSDGLYVDWFLYCKEIFYVLLAALISVYALGERMFPDHPCRDNPLYTKKGLPLVICAGSYLLLNVLSSLFSENKEVTLLGVCTEFEGSAAIFAYIVLFLFGANHITGKRIRSFYEKALLTLLAVVTAASLFEYTVMPIMKLPFMKYLIAPAQFRENAASLEAANDFREVILMFYNSNYTGSFFTLAFPMSVYFLMTAKKPIYRLGAAVLSAGAMAVGIMTNSTAAFYIMAAELVFLAVFALVKGVLHVKTVAVSVCAFAVLAVGVNFATGNDLLGNLLKSASNEGSYSVGEQAYWLKSVTVSGDTVHLVGRETEYFITPPTAEGQQLSASAGEGQPIVSQQQASDRLVIHDISTNTDITAEVHEGVLYIDCGYRTTLDFAVTTNGVKAIIQNAALTDDLPTAPMAESSLTKYYGFATGRGYIWLNSLPILRSCIFLGKGAGNFPFWFTQNDLAGLCVTNGTSRIVIDKPHSMYLQIAVTSGIIALLAVLILFGGVVFKGGAELLRLKKGSLSNEDSLLLCLFTGVCGYMVISLVNDSSVTVAPFFWLNFGVLCNLLLTRKEAAHD